MSRRLSLISIAIATLVAAPNAEAFCRQTTCADQSSCPRDAEGCQTTGEPLFWSGSCLSYSLTANPDPNLPPAAVDEAIAAAFAVWSEADCGGGRHPSIAAVATRSVSCMTPGFDVSGPNANLFVFEPSWNAEDELLARALLTFTTTTGEIRDADVEFNASGNRLTVDDTDINTDLQSVATHAAGHFFGLDHSRVTSSVMNATYVFGTLRRALDPDDVNAICTVYPPERRAACDATPHDGLATCDGGAGTSGGVGGAAGTGVSGGLGGAASVPMPPCSCAFNAPATGGPGAAFALTTAFAAVLARRRSEGGSRRASRATKPGAS